MDALPDLGALLRHAQRCDAVYEIDEAKARAAYAALDRVVITRYSSSTAQAVLSVAVGAPAGTLPDLDIAGTRVSCGVFLTAAADVLEDAQDVVYNYDLGGDARVASGAHSRAIEVWIHMRDYAPLGCYVHGHSLGGGAVGAMMTVMPAALFKGGTSWGGIKAFNDAGWKLYADARKKIVHVVNGRDPWAYHPWRSELRWTPEPILWLDQGRAQWVSRDKWPGPNALHASDHDMSQIVIDMARLVLAAGFEPATKPL